MADQTQSQADNVKAAARELGTDDDAERIGKLVKHKPVPEPERPE